MKNLTIENWFETWPVDSFLPHCKTIIDKIN